LIYLDASVVLAQLLAEERRPAPDLWGGVLISSRLLEYEVYSVINARGLSKSHDEEVCQLLARIAILEMIPEILDRSRSPFPVPLRTLDGLHLASIDFLREQRQDVQLASYDNRMIMGAKRLGIDVIELN
jgi:hypothetical protein